MERWLALGPILIILILDLLAAGYGADSRDGFGDGQPPRDLA
jgi:hypothetical protein